jgi:NAD-dependent dihydropyrimidine dehydrogenase PreA subunit
MSAAERKKYIVELDAELCKACGYCAESCKKEVFRQTKTFNAQGYLPFEAAYPENCTGCLSCLCVCPDFALVVRDCRIGEVKSV